MSKKGKQPPKYGKGSKSIKKGSTKKDSYRLTSQGKDITPVTSETVMVDMDYANKLLEKNDGNRKISWPTVKKYRIMMEKGEWVFHAQGIIIDSNGNLQTGQTRLWAVVQSKTVQPFVIVRGSPPEGGKFIDRGRPQTPRDLASRVTDRRHSVYEEKTIRALLALEGTHRPTHDIVADRMIDHNLWLKEAMKAMRRVEKEHRLFMILGVLCKMKNTSLFGKIKALMRDLAKELKPNEASELWNRGAVFTEAMEKAKEVCIRRK
jgi:hypothetical protein